MPAKGTGEMGTMTLLEDAGDKRAPKEMERAVTARLRRIGTQAVALGGYAVFLALSRGFRA